MRDIKPFLIAMLAIGLVATWAWHLYDKAHYAALNAPVPGSDSLLVRDSLRAQFASLQTGGGADPSDLPDSLLQEQIRERQQEVTALRGEISSILQREAVTNEDLARARTKLSRLESLLQGFRQRTADMESEREVLLKLLAGSGQPTDSVIRKMSQLDAGNSRLRDELIRGNQFVSIETRLRALNAAQTAVLKAGDVHDWEISFVLRNDAHSYDNEPLYLVLTQPGGKVLQDAEWNSGVFDIKPSGRRPFTRLVRTDYEAGALKPFRLVLPASSPAKGAWRFQLWHRGLQIAEAGVTLK